MKKIIIGLVIVLLVGAIWGWMTVQSEAESRVEQWVYEHELDDKIQYEGVSYNPVSSRLVLDKVKFQTQQGGFQAEQLVIADWKSGTNTDMPDAIDLSLEGVKIDLQQFQRMTFVDLAGSELIALGYKALQGDIRLSYKLDKSDDRLAIEFMYDFDGVGKLRADIELAHVKAVIRRFSDNPVELLSLSRWQQVALGGFSADYIDDGFSQRMLLVRKLKLQQWPDDDVEQKISEANAAERDNLFNILMKEGLPEESLTENIDAIYEFVSDPEIIRVRTELDQPVRFGRFLSHRKSRWGSSSEFSPKLFYELVNLEIDNG